MSEIGKQLKQVIIVIFTVTCAWRSETFHLKNTLNDYQESLQAFRNSKIPTLNKLRRGSFKPSAKHNQKKKKESSSDIT